MRNLMWFWYANYEKFNVIHEKLLHISYFIIIFAGNH